MDSSGAGERRHLSGYATYRELTETAQKWLSTGAMPSSGLRTMEGAYYISNR